MTIYEYLSKYGDINLKEEQTPEISAIRNQGFRHLFRTEKDTLVSDKRPLESENTRKWREKNRRLTSHDVTSSAILESSAIINSSGFMLTGLGKDLSEWLNTNKFGYLGSKVDLWKWVMECIYPLSLADPNAKVIAFPINNIDKTLNPNESDPTKKINVEIKIIPSEKILPTKDDGLFVFLAGEKMFLVDGKNTKEKYYYIADDVDWYLFEPTRRDEGKLIYEASHWYKHDTGFVPVVSVPGILSQDEKGNKFQESFFKGAFPHLDEHTARYSDNQFMNTRNSYPTLVMPPISCSACAGEGMVKDDKGLLTLTCSACSGTGKQRTPGISEFMLLSDKDFGEKGDPRNPFWLGPDTNSLEYHWKIVWELLDKACASIGINSLIGSTESGEAMKMRMQKFENLVNVIYTKICEFTDNTLFCINKLISKENAPSVKREVRLTVKTPEYLRLIYKDALPIEKVKIAMEILMARYGNDPNAVRIYNYILDNHPSALFEPSDIKDYIGLGIYTIEEIRESQTVLNRLIRISKEYDIKDLTDDQIKLKLNGPGQI